MVQIFMMSLSAAAIRGVKGAMFHVTLNEDGTETWQVALSGDDEDAESSACAAGPSLDVAFTRAMGRFKK